MKTQSNNFQNLKEDSSAIFQELFGLFGNKESKKDPNEPIYEDEILVIYSNSEVKFKQTGSVVKKPMPGYAAFTNLNWDNDGIKWLSTSEFAAESVQIKDNKVDRFVNGKWYSGPFKGRAFIKSEFGVKDGNKAYFAGGGLVDSVWNPSPYYFIEGTTNESDTILGIKNIKTLNQNKFNFNIISVIPGRKIIITMENNISHEVSILKRLDDSSSHFNFRIKNGHTKEIFTMPLRWSAIRGNSVGEFIELTTLSNQRVPRLFSEIFGLKFDSLILKVIVTNDTEYGSKRIEVPAQQNLSNIPLETPADLSKKQVSFELINLPFLGIDKIPRKGGSETSLFFNFPTPQSQQGYNSIVDAAAKGWIKAYAVEVKNALDNKIIKGAPSSLPYLSSLIGKDDSVDLKNIDPTLFNSLNGLESFLRFFVNNLVRRVRKTGAEKGIYDIEDIVGKDMIKDRLRSILGVQKAAEVDKTGPESPSKDVKKNFPKAKFAENQQVRDIIKDILSENLKHF